MESGKGRDASSDVILTALAEVNPGALEKALELTAELKLDRAKPDLVKILADGAIPLGSRLRAAVALAAMGDRRGSGLVRKSALERCEPRYYAIAQLTGLLGDDAANVLCELMRQGDDDIAAEAALAMRDVSVKAGIPSLLTLLREGPPCSLDAVVECLEWKGAASKAAIPDLVKLLETEPRTRNPLWTQQLAAMALGKFGPDAAPALPALIRLAERHAPAEWDRVKNHPPSFINPFDRRARIADDYFVDAILRVVSQVI
jgi:HEAT repeat protein